MSASVNRRAKKFLAADEEANCRHTFCPAPTRTWMNRKRFWQTKSRVGKLRRALLAFRVADDASNLAAFRFARQGLLNSAAAKSRPHARETAEIPQT